jgi:hypothetical protein
LLIIVPDVDFKPAFSYLAKVADLLLSTKEFASTPALRAKLFFSLLSTLLVHAPLQVVLSHGKAILDRGFCYEVSSMLDDD